MNTYIVELTKGHESPTRLTTRIHHRRQTTTPGTTCPLKGCETGPLAHRPYPGGLESLTISRCNYKGSTFSLSPQLFKDPKCWSDRS